MFLLPGLLLISLGVSSASSYPIQVKPLVTGYAPITVAQVQGGPLKVTQAIQPALRVETYHQATILLQGHYSDSQRLQPATVKAIQ